MLEKQIKSPVKDKVDWCKAWKKLCCASVPTSPKTNEQGELEIFSLNEFTDFPLLSITSCCK